MDYLKLSFGALAAERDIAEGLKDYFVYSSSFHKFKQRKKFIALGNRGAGKSAIFKMLADEERRNGAIVIELAPENCTYELFAETLKAERDGSWAKTASFSAAWKYLLYVRAMKALDSQGRRLQGSDAVRIHKYLRDNHLNSAMQPLDVLLSYLKRLEGIKIGKFEAGVRTRELQRLYRLEEIDDLLPRLDRVCANQGVLILIDELDYGWDKSENAQAFVAGLIQAAVAMNAQTPNLRVLVSLRREIFECIPALCDDAQKLRDYVEVIEWDQVALKSMIARRIAHSYPDKKLENPDKLWNMVFPDVFEETQTKSFGYIVERTLYRPRELIQFCQEIRSRILASGSRPEYELIRAAELAYSRDRVLDTSAEYRFQYPGLLSVFETFRGLDHTLEREMLELHCLRLAAGELHVDEQASWVRSRMPDELISSLWNVGFLCAKPTGGVRGVCNCTGNYIGQYQIAVLNLANIHHFHIHPMFRAYLGLGEDSAQD